MDMYGIMVVFDSHEVNTSGRGRRKEGLNFGNMDANSKGIGDGDTGGGGGAERRL